MCGNIFRIKGVNRFAPSKYAVKCGICKQCRQMEQSAWSFRLRCELEECHNRGWKIGFCTLTYDAEHLPHIPEALVRVGDKKLPCFSRSGVRDFIVSIRKFLYDNYDIGRNKDNIRYMVCAEYGSTTKRPHYHAVFSWPPYKDLDAQKFLDLIRDKWSFGYVFPRHYLGGLDSHHYKHQSFEVTSNPSGACKYISKYISKDIDFYRSLSDITFCDDTDLTEYEPFHLQSRSLGLSRFVGLSDSQKLEYVTKGFSFVGDDKPTILPLYLKRKIFFNPLYVYEREIFQSGRKVDLDDSISEMSDSDLLSLGFELKSRRLVRREATQFFKDNFQVIYKNQLKAYTKFFERAFDKVYLKSHGFTDVNARDFSELLNYTFVTSSPERIAEAYLCYHGLTFDKCFDVDPAVQWYLRYDSHNEIDTSTFKSVGADYYESVRAFIPLILQVCVSCIEDYSKLDEQISKVRDLFKSTTY